MTEVAKAYIAGYIDGEGCICWRGCPTVALETCNPNPLMFVQESFGGVVKKRNRLTKANRTVYLLAYHGQNAIDVLNTIIPYLIEKKVQAESVRDMYELNKKLNNEKRKNHI